MQTGIGTDETAETGTALFPTRIPFVFVFCFPCAHLSDRLSFPLLWLHLASLRQDPANSISCKRALTRKVRCNQLHTLTWDDPTFYCLLCAVAMISHLSHLSLLLHLIFVISVDPLNLTCSLATQLRSSSYCRDLASSHYEERPKRSCVRLDIPARGENAAAELRGQRHRLSEVSGTVRGTGKLQGFRRLSFVFSNVTEKQAHAKSPFFLFLFFHLFARVSFLFPCKNVFCRLIVFGQ